MELISSAFGNNQNIPNRFTGDGKNISPPLKWTGLPPKCKSVAIICEDPDASTAHKGGEFPFVHWLIYNITPGASPLPEGIAHQEILNAPYGATQGVNSFGEIGYGGPRPPVGDPAHHYVFTLYALRKDLELAPGLTKEALLHEMHGNILETTTFIGTYARAGRKVG